MTSLMDNKKYFFFHNSHRNYKTIALFRIFSNNLPLIFKPPFIINMDNINKEFRILLHFSVHLMQIVLQTDAINWDDSLI